jgi:hypothetical protein
MPVPAAHRRHSSQGGEIRRSPRTAPRGIARAFYHTRPPPGGFFFSEDTECLVAARAPHRAAIRPPTRCCPISKAAGMRRATPSTTTRPARDRRGLRQAIRHREELQRRSDRRGDGLAEGHPLRRDGRLEQPVLRHAFDLSYADPGVRARSPGAGRQATGRQQPPGTNSPRSARRPDSNYTAGTDSLAKTAAGDYLNANPYLDKMYDSAARGVTRAYQTATAPNTDSTYETAGRYGSGAHGSAVRKISRISASRSTISLPASTARITPPSAATRTPPRTISGRSARASRNCRARSSTRRAGNTRIRQSGIGANNLISHGNVGQQSA